MKKEQDETGFIWSPSRIINRLGKRTKMIIVFTIGAKDKFQVERRKHLNDYKKVFKTFENKLSTDFKTD